MKEIDEERVNMNCLLNNTKLSVPQFMKEIDELKK